jgi:hypothetical protein
MSNTDLSDIDPTHAQNRILVSTDVNASAKFLEGVTKKNAHNATNCIHALYDQCEQTKCCTGNDRWQFQTLSNLMQNKLNQNVRRLDDLPGLECLHPQDKWCNMSMKSTATRRITSLPSPINLMRMPLHKLNRTEKMMPTQDQPHQSQIKGDPWNWLTTPSWSASRENEHDYCQHP